MSRLIRGFYKHPTVPTLCSLRVFLGGDGGGAPDPFLRDDDLSHVHNLYQSTSSETGFNFSGSEEPRTCTTSKVTSATPHLALNNSWDAKSIPQKTADLINVLRREFPTLVPGLDLMMADGNLLGSVNAMLRLAGIPLTEKQVTVPDPAAEAAAEARRKAHASAMRLWRKAKLDAEAKGLDAPAKPICPPRIPRERIRTYSVDQDALTLALRRSERYALGLLGGVQAPIESFDPRVCAVQASPDVEALLNLSPATPATPTPTAKVDRRTAKLLKGAAEARDEALRAIVAAAETLPGLDVVEEMEAELERELVEQTPPTAITQEPVVAPEPRLMMVVALGHDGEEAMLSVLASNEADGFRRLEDAFRYLHFQAIGSRHPTPAEIEEHEARLPDEFWASAA